MKGMVFSEFVEMVEAKYGMDITDEMFERAKPATGGSYVYTGTYPHEELISLVVALSGITNVAVPDLVHTFGKHLFGSLARAHPQYLARCDNVFDFLMSIHGHIHVEVRKLYPDAELPHFTGRTTEDGRRLDLEYRSARRFDALAHGLIEGALEHFRESASVERHPLPADEPGSLFVIRKLSV